MQFQIPSVSKLPTNRVSLKLVSPNSSYWAQTAFLYLITVTLTLIFVTPWAILNPICMQAAYISSLVEIGHSLLKLLSGNVFSILAPVTLTSILVTPWATPYSICIQATYTPSFVEIGHSFLKLLSGYGFLLWTLVILTLILETPYTIQNSVSIKPPIY